MMGIDNGISSEVPGIDVRGSRNCGTPQPRLDESDNLVHTVEFYVALGE